MLVIELAEMQMARLHTVIAPMLPSPNAAHIVLDSCVYVPDRQHVCAGIRPSTGWQPACFSLTQLPATISSID